MSLSERTTPSSYASFGIILEMGMKKEHMKLKKSFHFGQRLHGELNWIFVIGFIWIIKNMHANFIGRFVMIDGEAFRSKCGHHVSVLGT